MSVGDVRAHYDGVYALLSSLFTGGPLPSPIGDSEQPETFPNVTLYAIPGGFTSGTLGDTDGDLEMPFQITCVSRRRDQAQLLQHAVRNEMLNQTLTVTGRSLLRVNLESPSGVERDDRLGEREGQVFYTADTFHVRTAPA